MGAATGFEAVGASLWRGIVVQAEVVYALVLRETRTRFGLHKLGYLWALIEPILIILMFWGLAELSHRSAPPGMDVFSFLATGLVPYTLFSSSVGRVAESINANRALLYYPPVRPLDLVLARGALEGATHCAVFLVLMGSHGLVRQELSVDSLLDTLFGLVLASLLGTATGLVFCCLGQLSPTVDRVRGPLLRPLFWVSGIFFTVDWIPEHLRTPALRNPVLHTTELVRAGWFASYGGEHVDVGYVLGWIVALSCVGLALERAVRKRIELS